LTRIKDRYDDPHIAGYRDRYFQAEDIPGIVDDINRSRPDILFIGLGIR